ncbi:MAG: AAA family ATPase [Lachnospiraceae bacterium]
MNARDYFKTKQSLIPDILKAYPSPEEKYDIIVIEGAGSPAEINLKQDDIVNMGMAKLVDAPVLLVGDIDRGGVFAQLYGTVELLEPEEKARIRGPYHQQIPRGQDFRSSIRVWRCLRS